ncbi:MAG: hypothetical protein PHZ04_01040 [Patescibacteria group bacterium]|nr:hypothetical protein [Patescibacteria group bacterium]
MRFCGNAIVYPNTPSPPAGGFGVSGRAKRKGAGGKEFLPARSSGFARLRSFFGQLYFSCLVATRHAA